MPFLWLESDELKALQDVFDWKRRIGQPLDWAAFERAKSRIVKPTLDAGRGAARGDTTIIPRS